MDGSASIVRSGEMNRHAPTLPPSSKLKTYGFAIAIIVGIGGLAVGAAGLAGYFHVGALRNMAQVDAIIMMAAGGGGGIILLIIGIVGTVKNRQSKDGSVYGPEAWKIWNVEVSGAVPPIPRVDLSKKDKVLLYIPQRIRVAGKEQNLTLKVLKEISGGPFSYFSEDCEQLGGNIAPGGWVLIERILIPESRGQNYEAQKALVEDRGCSLPTVLEAIVLNLMVFAFTGERLYGQEPVTYTRCIEKVDGQYPVIVGAFGPRGLTVGHSHINDNDVAYGAACVLRKF